MISRRISYAAFVLIVFLFASCSNRPDSTFSFSPEKPMPGQTITVTYNPTGTSLEEVSQIDLAAFIYSGDKLGPGDEPVAQTVQMEKKGKVWTAIVETESNNRLLLLRFENDEAVDSNTGRGYFVNLFSNEGIPVPGAKACMASAVAFSFQYYPELENDYNKALSLLQEDLAAYPHIKRNFFQLYFNLLRVTKHPDAEEITLKDLYQIAAMDALSLDELSYVNSWFKSMNKPDEAKKYEKVILERRPRGKFANNKRHMEAYREDDITKKIQLHQNYIRDFPDSKYIWISHQDISEAYQKEGKYKEAYEYLRDNPVGERWGIYYRLSKEMVEKGILFPLAIEASAKALDLTRTGLKILRQPKWPFETQRKIKQFAQRDFNITLSYHGNLLVKTGKEDEAFPFLEEAYKSTNGSDPEVNENYLRLLTNYKNYDNALEVIEEIYSLGNETANIKNTLKEVYLVKFGNSDGFIEYVNDLQDLPMEKLREKIEGQILDLPAPDFTLEELDGNKITLSELRGKIVIIDFWATWCGPCLASFPGMKMAVEKYADKNDVQFLFINSMEYGEDKSQIVKDFTEKNDWPFTIIIDEDDSVRVDKYKVSSIPTKFIIDKQGKIRFKSIGFDGNTDKLVKELILMIEMLK